MSLGDPCHPLHQRDDHSHSFDLNVCCLALQPNLYRFVENEAVARMFLNSVARMQGTSRGPAEMDVDRPSIPQRRSVKVRANSCSVGVSCRSIVHSTRIGAVEVFRATLDTQEPQTGRPPQHFARFRAMSSFGRKQVQFCRICKIYET